MVTLPLEPSSTMGQVGRQLAIIGDDINQRYDSEFQAMLQHLQPTAENAYEYFTKIASSLFESGINWGRVVALLGFGYRLALHVYQRGLTGFLGQVTRFVADFMLHHCIARWIAQRGGWVAALNLGNGPILNVLIVLSVVLLGQFVPTGLGERREKFMIKPNAGSGCRWSPLTSPHPLSVSENKL
ncbi:bcl-2 homologous antagonist/killer isoform X5 [Vulpes vulpes]|nr:bcl-2 homologous antagonist/killer isoform X3 [Canis lupus dingo]XP_038538682.1 bcl-2 homologous antagonist/killer isoform X3 [Canis lupus familiaris]|eukprot:XP_022281446.1 bcl-2 homologous antagonist/killer isoform X4 [Canis lupus familiaris]